MNTENLGYSLAVTNRSSSESHEKIWLKPMALYVPDIAVGAVAELVAQLADGSENEKGFMLTVTNKNNGVSVDKEIASLAKLLEPTFAADAVKDLINIVRGYESDEETNVCGW